MPEPVLSQNDPQASESAQPAEEPAPAGLVVPPVPGTLPPIDTTSDAGGKVTDSQEIEPVQPGAPAQPAPHTLPTIDTTSDTGGKASGGQEIPLHTSDWAKEVRPFALFILSLIASVMIIPFISFFTHYPTGDYMKQELDWAKTILAPVIGFGGAVIGYYFGARSSDK
jgi:hypothetical protein